MHFARLLRPHPEQASALDRRCRALAILPVGLACLAIGDLVLIRFVPCPEMAMEMTGRSAVDLDSDPSWDFPPAAVAADFSAARSLPSAAASIGRLIFDPGFDSIDFAIAPAVFAVAVGLAAAGFDPAFVLRLFVVARFSSAVAAEA